MNTLRSAFEYYLKYHFVFRGCSLTVVKLTWCSFVIVFYAEVSDQNFVDNHPGEVSGGMPNAKRLKKASSDSSANDQVQLGIAFDFFSLENL